MFGLKDKVVLVTGGAKGIGAAAVQSFLDEEAKFVAFLDIDFTSGIAFEQDLRKKYGEKSVKFFKCDITKDDELLEIFNYTVVNHGYIDVVLNNAAIANDAMPRKEIEINFTAVVTITLKALNMMRKDHGGKGGTIINISSIGGIAIQKNPTLYVYCATKSAVLMFGANLGMEAYYSQTGVRVITMCFGLTTTGLSNNLNCIDDFSNTSLKNMMGTHKAQPPTAAAAGIMEAFKKGKSGSTWLVMASEIADITERVTKAYQVMSGEIHI